MTQRNLRQAADMEDLGVLADLEMVPASSSVDGWLELAKAAQEYCQALYHHGQIYGDYLVGPGEGCLRATVDLARCGASALKHHSKRGREAWLKLRSACKVLPKWNLIGRAGVRWRWNDWRKASALVLNPDPLDCRSPVFSGSDGCAVPVYLLPLGDSEINDLVQLQLERQSLFGIWMQNKTLEIRAYKELADHNSDLSRRGLELCRKIEDATKLPMYYFLYRFFGRRDADRERNRRCPVCGGKWLHTSTLETGVDCFELLCCKRCHLVSDTAVYDDDRYAHIGEYKADKPKSRKTSKGKRKSKTKKT